LACTTTGQASAFASFDFGCVLAAHFLAHSFSALCRHKAEAKDASSIFQAGSWESQLNQLSSDGFVSGPHNKKGG
jgi:hypothetical protein